MIFTKKVPTKSVAIGGFFIHNEKFSHGTHPIRASLCYLKMDYTVHFLRDQFLMKYTRGEVYYGVFHSCSFLWEGMLSFPMPNNGDTPLVGGEGTNESGDAIRVADMDEYLQHRRAYLMSRRDSAETDFGKAKFIGALQALNDFELMVKQLRVTATPSGNLACLQPGIPDTVEALGAQWLVKFGFPNISLDDFRDTSWQNKMIAQHPDKKEAIMLIGNLARNRTLVATVFKSLREGAEGSPSSLVAPAAPAADDGSNKCPYCGKTYKYAKALDSHKKTCPKNSTPGA